MKKNFIVSNPAVMMGKPVIAGTRIPVELIIGESLGTFIWPLSHLSRSEGELPWEDLLLRQNDSGWPPEYWL